jgi:hypothetical protein
MNEPEVEVLSVAPQAQQNSGLRRLLRLELDDLSPFEALGLEDDGNPVRTRAVPL